MKRDNENFRSHRVSSLIKKEIALVKQELSDTRLKDIFIIDVEVSRDLKHAKVYFGIFGSENKKTEDIENSKKLIDLSKNFLVAGKYLLVILFNSIITAALLYLLTIKISLAVRLK